VSAREIARRLDAGDATVRRALAVEPQPTERPSPLPRLPILLSRPIRAPEPCPSDALPFARRLYDALAQRALLGELDCLIVALDLAVERTHVTLNVFDAEVVLGRLEREGVDLEPCVARLQSAFDWDDRLRAWARETAQAAG
jgi:hypothetical protein